MYLREEVLIITEKVSIDKKFIFLMKTLHKLFSFSMVRLIEEEPSKNLPWVEKYRPKQLNELVSHQEIIKTCELLTFLSRN